MTTALANPDDQNCHPATYSPELIAAAEEFGMSPQEYAEMMGESDLTRDMLPLWRFNGQDGVYVDKGKQPYNADDHVKDVSGIILGVFYSQVWLRDYANPKSYSQPWLCMSGDKRQPPRVHPELTEDEIKYARGVGAGVDCMSCVLAQWSAEGEHPICSRGIRLLLLLDTNEVVLMALGGNSATDMDKFLALNFKANRRPWSSYQVLFGRVKVAKPEMGQSYYKATCSKGEAVPAASQPGLMEIRRRNLANFEKSRDAEPVEAMHDKPFEGETSDAPAESEMEFDEHGNPVFKILEF